MKLSEITTEQLQRMSLEQLWHIDCDGVVDEGKSGDVALLLGGGPVRARERALAAAALYHSGRVPYIIPSGGVKWDVDGEQISECDYMTRIMIEHGVPAEAIIAENEATTTKENMMFAAIRMHRALRLDRISHVVLVTSQSHMKRSMGLARALLPRKLTVSAYPSYPEDTKETWLSQEENQKILRSAVLLMKGLVDCGFIEDMEVTL